MKVWIKNHRYIFNKYRDTIKCVLECIDESPIVKQIEYEEKTLDKSKEKIEVNMYDFPICRKRRPRDYKAVSKRHKIYRGELLRVSKP